MIIIPEILLFKAVEGIINKLIVDTKTAQQESDTFIYRLFKGLTIETFDFYKSTKEMLLRPKDHPRQLQVRLFFDASRATLPTIHITLPSENPEFNGIGIDEGYEDDIIDGDNNKIFPQYTRMSTATYNVVVTSDNTFEVIIIHSLLKYMSVALMDVLELNGLRNIKISAQDILLQNDLIPTNIFSRALSINFSYENSVPSFTGQSIFDRISIMGNLVSSDLYTAEIVDGIERVFVFPKGEKGDKGDAGISIVWLGIFASPPSSPPENGAYRNSVDGICYIWDGFQWWELVEDGREIELQKSLTHIQWRYVGESWFDLVALSDITGPQGAPAITYEKRHKWINPYSYNGKAPLGSSESDAVWKIVRIEIAGDGSVVEIKTLNNVKWSDVLILIF